MGDAHLSVATWPFPAALEMVPSWRGTWVMPSAPSTWVPLGVSFSVDDIMEMLF